MGRDMYEKFPAARDIFDRANKALGFDITALCFDGPEDELKKTANAQPAILTVSVACLEVLRQRGLRPYTVAGHSLGEYTALVAAGSLDFEDAVLLVRLRGQYMQESVPLGEGGMVAVLGMETDVISDICSGLSGGAGVVEAANINCPGQVVISGDTRSLEKAVSLLKEKGAKKCLPLSVSAPFHSSMMRPAGEKLEVSLSRIIIKDPEIPVLSNVTAGYHGKGPEIKHLLVEQVSSPVRWEECVRRMILDGTGVFIEVGPGKVLSGLVRKITRDVEAKNVEDSPSLEKVLASFGEVS